MNHENDTDIQIALVPAPMDGPYAEMKRKLRVLAHETPARAPWWRSPLAAPLSLAGTVAAVVVVTAMLPAKASAKSFDLIVAAAERIDAFQFSVRSNEKGKPEAFTIAGSNGHVTMRMGDGGLMQIDPGSMSIYSKEENKVTRLKFGGLMDAESAVEEMQSGISEGLKEMDLNKMLHEYREKYGLKGVRISPVVQENGRSVYHVTLAAPDQPERVELTVDSATDLPDSLRVASKGGTLVDMEMRFGARVDPAMLRAPFPTNVKVEEIDLSKMVDGAMKGLRDLGRSFEDKTAKPK